MALLETIFIIFFLVYLLGAIVAVFTFVIDVLKWHPREQRVKVTPSAQSESEVTSIERRGDLGRGTGSTGACDDNNNSNSGESDNNNSNGYF